VRASITGLIDPDASELNRELSERPIRGRRG